jgi:hypothetical protein
LQAAELRAQTAEEKYNQQHDALDTSTRHASELQTRVQSTSERLRAADEARSRAEGAQMRQEYELERATSRLAEQRQTQAEYRRAREEELVELRLLADDKSSLAGTQLSKMAEINVQHEVRWAREKAEMELSMKAAVEKGTDVREQLDAEVSAHKNTRQRLLRQLYEMSAPFPARGGGVINDSSSRSSSVGGGRNSTVGSAGRGRNVVSDDASTAAGEVEGDEGAGRQQGDSRGQVDALDFAAAGTPEQRAPASPTASTDDREQLEQELQQQQRTHSRLLSQVSELRQAALADARLLADAERRRAVEQSQWKVRSLHLHCTCSATVLYLRHCAVFCTVKPPNRCCD